MKKQLKVISLLGFSVLFLSACGKNTAGNKVAAAPMKAQANKPETIDLQKLSPQEKAQVEKQALDVKNLLKLTSESDQVFQEVWEVFLNQQKSENLFKGINRALKSGYSEDGLPLAKSLDEKEQCQRASLKIERQAEVVENEIKFQAPQAYSLVEGSCSALPGTTLIYAMKNEQGKHYFAIKHLPQDENTWVGGNISMYGFPVERKAEGASANPSKKSTYDIEKTKTGSDPWDKSSQGVRCDLTMNETGKLWSLSCANIGHDDAADRAVVFKDLRWNSHSNEQSIVASGLRMKVTMEKGPQVVSSFSIADSISKNEIVISEKEIESGEEKSRAVPREDKALQVPDVNPEIGQNTPANNSEVLAPAKNQAKEVKPLSEVNTNEPVMQSGDQAISPDQVGVDGEIVPLEQIDTATQGIPSVR